MSPTCKNCGEGFPARYRKPSSKDKLLFCNKSCSASYNNKHRESLKKVKLCSFCGVDPVHKKSKYCLDCKETGAYSTKVLALDGVSLLELKNSYEASQYHSKVRSHARSVFARSLSKRECRVCQYSKHVDICHIKDVKDFDLTCMLREVNDLSNLLPLCRNHHWEFDHDLLSEDDKALLGLTC